MPSCALYPDAVRPPSLYEVTVMAMVPPTGICQGTTTPFAES